MIEIIKQWSDLIIGSGLAITLAGYIKKWLENKKLRQKVKNITDEKQNKWIVELKEEMSNIKDEFKKHKEEHFKILEKLNFLYDNAKNGIFQRTIKKELKKQLNVILNINKIKNAEFSRILTNGLNAYIYTITDVLLYDFDINGKQLYDVILQHLDNARQMVNVNELGLKNPLDFLKKLEDDILYPSVKVFIYEFCNLQKLENGERRKALSDLGMRFNINNINNIIELYTKEIKK